MMVLPLPAFVLDLLFTFNIALSIMVLLVAMFTQKTLEFAAFPTVLLFTTLLRLALNVASTRIILLEGHTGTAAAGRVVEAFGHFLVGGNFAIGIVVFIILVIINFMVITKGAGRIAEVARVSYWTGCRVNRWRSTPTLTPGLSVKMRRNVVVPM
jgi:flagellar biosynthesis protein FlhA